MNDLSIDGALYIAVEERHHALERDATFPWSRAFSNLFGGETKRVTPLTHEYASSAPFAIIWA